MDHDTTRRQPGDEPRLSAEAVRKLAMLLALPALPMTAAQRRLILAFADYNERDTDEDKR